MGIEYRDGSGEVKKIMRHTAISFLHEACGELVSQTAKNSRVDTGKTKGSFKYYVDEEQLDGYVGSDAENAIWEEFGTGEYALNGNGRKGGWFYVDAHGRGHYTHGKKPSRAFYKAFIMLRCRIEERARKLFGGME